MDSNNYTFDIKKQFEGKVIIITGSTQGSGRRLLNFLLLEVLKQSQFVEGKKIKDCKLKKKLKN